MRKPIAPTLLLLTQAAAAALIAAPAKAEVLDLSQYSVCVTASRAEQTLNRRIDCGKDALRCFFTEGPYGVPGEFELDMRVNAQEPQYVFLTMYALRGVVAKDYLASPITTTAAALTSSAGYETGLAATPAKAHTGEYDGTAVFRLVPKGADCESSAAAPAAASASGAPAAGQSWSDWFWSWFQ